MLATIPAAILVGVDGRAVSVEVHVTTGLPSFNVVGLQEAPCREARDRVRAALVSSGFRWPQGRVTVNLSPSGVRKAGSGLDLPIAVGLLVADGQLAPELISDCAFIGELGLDGKIRAVPGTLALVEALAAPAVVVAADSVTEAELSGRQRVLPATTLRSVIASLSADESWPTPAQSSPAVAKAGVACGDLADVRGQPVGRLAVEIAAAGGHHILLCGPPGAGKTMLAERVAGLLPDLTGDQALEVTRVHSACGMPLPTGSVVPRPPFRAPRHAVSMVALIGGGGARMRPGEISCSHHGVLFLDELAGFTPLVLDSLRQPLESGYVVVARASATVVLPARFLLVAAMNLCPCGGEAGPGGCRCSGRAVRRYANRISGPLLDRFDLRVSVERPDITELVARSAERVDSGETSEVVARRVASARSVAAARGVICNAAIPDERLDELVPLDAAAVHLFEVRLRQGRLSARGFGRVRRVARTVADLSDHLGPVGVDHVATALALRSGPSQPKEWSAPCNKFDTVF